MNELTLTRIAKQAALVGPMVINYPDSTNNEVTFPPSPYYRFLKLLAENIGAQVSVELGVDGGGGSLHLAMGSIQAVGVDIAWNNEVNITWIIKHNPNFTFIQGDSVQLARIIYEKYGEIDILFIDTTHTHEQTMKEYNTYLPYLSAKGIVCLDDLYRPGMDKVWNDMPKNKVRFDFLHPSGSPTDGGFGVIWK